MEVKISKEAEERKDRSEAILSKFGVPINKHLPYIEDSNEALIRTTSEVATRALALLVVAVKAEGLEQEIVNNVIKSYDLSKAFTPKELEFINNPEPTPFDKTQFIWRYEAAWVLLWALGYVPELTHPNSICDVPAAVTFMQQRSKSEFINDSQLRSIQEILDENDLIYRYHWAVVDARVNNLQIPEDIDSSVVMERHYALNWLMGYMEQEWDDISTDT
ncbi:DUF4272 domain-containing protein [Ferrimonas kyonanensis]|uniref:DUF4272 domain-containing protein n=1 Tax=Ferrimonas kyonanensis TaxID=364763 RepID=UPI001B7FE113|nr:DUF4272 domain-containing protein [Ferrimonas kyonanensis]